jgi:hypothetical protein
MTTLRLIDSILSHSQAEGAVVRSLRSQKGAHPQNEDALRVMI